MKGLPGWKRTPPPPRTPRNTQRLQYLGVTHNGHNCWISVRNRQTITYLYCITSSDYRNPYIYCLYKIFFFVKNIKKKKKKDKKHVQLKALPGQPVCKHSVSMCFGRAPAPRARSKLQQGRRGCTRLLLPSKAAPGPASRPSPASHQGQGSGLGQADGSVTQLHPQPCLVVTHGFSWLLGGPWGRWPGGEAGEGPKAAWLGVSPAWVPLSCLVCAGPQQDSPTLKSTLVSALGPSGFRQPALPLMRLI